jgi:hypothetical protein
MEVNHQFHAPAGFSSWNKFPIHIEREDGWALGLIQH